VGQVTKQLNKLVNARKISELIPQQSSHRAHILVKVGSDAATRASVFQAVELFRANLADVSTDAVTVEATGAAQKLEALLEVLEPFGIRELVRSGTIAVARGGKSMTDRALTK